MSIPEKISRAGVEKSPKSFSLFKLKKEAVVIYGQDLVHFNPESSSLTILDRQAQRAREAVTDDLIYFVKLVEMLPHLDAQSTAVVCSDVTEEIKDLYRLYLALNYMSKPIVTGAFGIKSW